MAGRRGTRRQSSRRVRRWWSVEHGGAPRWLIVASSAVLAVVAGVALLQPGA